MATSPVHNLITSGIKFQSQPWKVTQQQPAGVEIPNQSISTRQLHDTNQWITFIYDNKADISAINITSVGGQTINPLQLILLSVAVWTIDINACWLSSEENWITDSISYFATKRPVNFKLD